jgi:hypothetical protein
MRSMFRSLLVGLVVVSALGGVAATSAMAVGGPEWIVKGASLEAGKAKTVKGSAVSEFQFNTAVGNFGCSKESISGEMIGGNPGTGKAAVTLTGCRQVSPNHPNCVLSSGKVSGEVLLSTKAVLVYPAGQTENTKAALVALVPEGLETGKEPLKELKPKVFAILTMQGAECGAFNNWSAPLEAGGTEITEPSFKRQCGLLAQLGKIEAGQFAATASGAQAVEGALSFKGAAGAQEGELWQAGKGSFKKVVCKLVFPDGASEWLGLTRLETALVEEFGWKV